MTSPVIFEALGGTIAVYVGVRFVFAPEILVVSEGGFEPLAWIKGRGAVIAGCLVVCAGLVLLAASLGLLRLP
jgi:hypothetical protein